MKALVLLSGGMDSTTALAMTLKDGASVAALTFNYGQRHMREIAAAKGVASFYDLEEHYVQTLDFSQIGGSALTDKSIDVPMDRPYDEMTKGIPASYVPARNTILLAFGLAFAERTEADAIVIAANALDFSGYPDCRPGYYKAMRKVATLGTKRGVEGRPVDIQTPVIAMSKADIVRTGQKLGVPWALTWSCYLGGSRACGRCDSCRLRLKGFKEAGVGDPIKYERYA